jgi:hypothetical protein
MLVLILAALLCFFSAETVAGATVQPVPCQCNVNAQCPECVDPDNPSPEGDGYCLPNPNIHTSGTCCAPTIGPGSPNVSCLAGQCGEHDNGCGFTIECPADCGDQTVCFNGACCVPQTCAQLNAQGVCGDTTDGCGHPLSCEPPPGTACNATFSGKVVACTHSTCPAAAQCGQVPDGDCFNTFLDCGACPSGQVCSANACINPAPAMPAGMTVSLGAMLAVGGFSFVRRRRRA